MTILPLEAAGSRTPEALLGFLGQCRATAARLGRPQLVSISLEVDALDPLAVLESIFEAREPHFYVERPAERLAVAGAEAATAFSAEGPDRFPACRRFVEETLSNAVAVGDLSAPFSGPHFFAAFAFSDRAEPGEPFPAATVFVPRWQVAHSRGRTVAIANLSVDGNSPVEALTERVWRAHAKFHAFDYAEPDFPGGAAPPRTRVTEVGPAGGFARAVERALEGIARGEFEKIVLARAKDLSASETLHPLRVLNGLRQRFSDCYSFSVANGRGQSFIGASPERLLRVDGGELATEALAGSAPRGASASEDAALAAALLRDDKELREHRLVLDFIAGRLRSLGLRPEFSDRPSIRRFANVQHLHTPLRAAWPAGMHPLDVLASLCPTPAVGGAPREAAVARIRSLEEFPRGLYAGALGWVDFRGGGEFFVGLRSALVDGAGARLYAGAGIVEGSSPGKEMAETEMKFGAMQEALLAGY
jgi:menaquinone-specific isochorismate synthase